jgi:hypothetical protein
VKFEKNEISNDGSSSLLYPDVQSHNSQSRKTHHFHKTHCRNGTLIAKSQHVRIMEKISKKNCDDDDEEKLSIDKRKKRT